MGIMNLDEIIDALKEVKDTYSNIKIGIAGSYVNGTYNSKSDIDIVIDGDSTKIEIMQYIKNIFTKSVDILWVDLMKKEDEELDKLALQNGLPVNKYSVYKTVMQEVVWV